MAQNYEKTRKERYVFTQKLIDVLEILGEPIESIDMNAISDETFEAMINKGLIIKK